MKKLYVLFFIVVLILAAAFVLTACDDGGKPAELPGNGEPTGSDPGGAEPSIDEPGPHVDEPDEPDAFFYKMSNFIIHMDDNIDDVINNVGEPLGKFEAVSCAFEGNDLVFSYPGIEIFTYPAGGNNFIHTIRFIDDSVRTTEGGILPGDNIQAVFDVYGNDYSYDTGVYTFTRGHTVLEFLTEDDGSIYEIRYRLPLDL